MNSDAFSLCDPLLTLKRVIISAAFHTVIQMKSISQCRPTQTAHSVCLGKSKLPYVWGTEK